MADQDILAMPRRVTAGGRLARRRGPPIAGPALDRSISLALSRAAMPLSAYDLVERLREQGSKVTAKSVYRSLDRLCARDEVQKVAMLAAYRIKDVAHPLLMICLECGATRSLAAPALHQALGESLSGRGFTPRRIACEVAGLCADCARRD